MKVLLTGGTGLIGWSFLDSLSGEHEVVAVTRRPQPPRDGVTWVEADLAEGLDPAALPEHVDAVLHLAQSDRYRDFPESASHVFAVNVGSTQALLDYARQAGATRFVLASSGSVYDPGTEPLRETTPVAPTGFYAATRYAAELLVGGYADTLGTVVLRPFVVYGPRQTGMLVSNLATRVLSGEEVVVQGTPGLRVNPIHVDDAVRAVRSALEGDHSGVFNLGGSEVVGIGDLATRLAAAAGVPAQVSHAEGTSADLVADTTRMREELGVDPGVPLDTGLAQVVEARREAAG